MKMLKPEEWPLSEEQCADLEKIQVILDRYGGIVNSFKKLVPNDIAECVLDIVGRHDFTQSPILLIKNIKSPEMYRLLHIVLTNVEEKETLLGLAGDSVVVQSRTFYEDQNLHRDKGDGFISLYCSQGGGHAATVFLDRKSCISILTSEDIECLKNADLWNSYENGPVSLVFDRRTIPFFLNQEGEAFEKAYPVLLKLKELTYTQHSTKVTLNNNEAVFFDDERLLHGRAAVGPLEEERRLLRLHYESRYQR